MDAVDCPRTSACASIDLSRLEHNLRLLAGRLSPSTQFHAVLKANAYGHGATAVANACAEIRDTHGRRIVRRGVVATIDEALELDGIDLPLAILRPVDLLLDSNADLIEHALGSGRILTVHTADAARRLDALARRVGRLARIQLMLDTGLTRCGISACDLPTLLDTIETCANLRLDSIGSQLACQDEPDHAANRTQLATFLAARQVVHSRPGPRPMFHLAASGATLLDSRFHFDAVRVGFAMFGFEPLPIAPAGLRPILRLDAPILAVRHVPAGTPVGYGHSVRTTHDARLAVVGIGYADGLPRALSNLGVMIVRGVACPIVGRISMDQTVIDLTACPAAGVGDHAIVFDNDPASPASVEAVASLAQTIAYEITCGIGRRVCRATTGSISKVESIQVDVNVDDHPLRRSA